MNPINEQINKANQRINFKVDDAAAHRAIIHAPLSPPDFVSLSHTPLFPSQHSLSRYFQSYLLLLLSFIPLLSDYIYALPSYPPRRLNPLPLLPTNILKPSPCLNPSLPPATTTTNVVASPSTTRVSIDTAPSANLATSLSSKLKVAGHSPLLRATDNFTQNWPRRCWSMAAAARSSSLD